MVSPVNTTLFTFVATCLLSSCFIAEKAKAQTEDPVPKLIRQLKDKDCDVRIQAATRLADLGPKAAKAIPELVQLVLADEDASLISAIALGCIGQKARPELEKLIGHRNANVRRSTTRALGSRELYSKPEDGVPLLARALSDEEELVRLEAVWALTELRPQSAIRHLIKVMRDDTSNRVREAAASSFDVFGDAAKDAVPDLVQILWKEEDPLGDDPIPISLGRIGAKALPALIDALKSSAPSKIKIRALSGLRWVEPTVSRKNCVLPVVQLMRDEDGKVRKEGIATLKSLRHDARAALPELIRLSKEGNPMEQLSASSAVTRIDESNPLLFSKIGEHISNKDKNIRSAAIQELIFFNGSINDASDSLTTALSDEEEQIKLNALSLVERLSPPPKTVIAGLRKLLDDPQEEVRKRAAKVLKNLEAKK